MVLAFSLGVATYVAAIGVLASITESSDSRRSMLFFAALMLVLAAATIYALPKEM